MRLTLKCVFVVSIALLAVPFCTRADEVFNLTGAFADATTVSGTVNIDVTTGTVDSVDLSYLGATFDTLLTATSPASSPVPGPFYGDPAGNTSTPLGYDFWVGSATLPSASLQFLVPGTSSPASLVNYAGGSLCSLVGSCGPDAAGLFWVSAYESPSRAFTSLSSGSLTAVPEPTSLLLSAIGLVGLALMYRRAKSPIETHGWRD